MEQKSVSHLPFFAALLHPRLINTMVIQVHPIRRIATRLSSMPIAIPSIGPHSTLDETLAGLIGTLADGSKVLVDVHSCCLDSGMFVDMPSCCTGELERMALISGWLCVGHELHCSEWVLCTVVV